MMTGIMEKAFKHPLARNATVAKARQRGGADETLLLIVTTLELEESAKGFNQRNVARLRHAADEYVAGAPGISGYALVNRPKEWNV